MARARLLDEPRLLRAWSRTRLSSAESLRGLVLPAVDRARVLAVLRRDAAGVWARGGDQECCAVTRVWRARIEREEGGWSAGGGSSAE